MATWLRRLVSGKKKRFQDGPHGFDLDLAYISPRIIAMGLPAEGKDVLYRNPLPEIARFLQTYHKGRAKVYNLCSEYKYPAEKLSVQLQHYPFDDHQTPALLVVQQFCSDAAAWLAAHPHNVVVVHCKAGKGRTGLMICSLLLYLHCNAPHLANLPEKELSNNSTITASGGTAATPAPETAIAAAAATTGATAGVLLPSLKRLSRTFSGDGSVRGGSSSGAAAAAAAAAARSVADSGGESGWHPWHFVEPVQLQQLAQPARDVLDLYAERRTHDGNGVTIASQRRYVCYFWSVLARGPKPCGTLPQPRTLQLREVVVAGLPVGSADSCVVLVEARPSGSCAASGSRVLTSTARRPPGGGMPGLCMAPCSQPPQVLEDGCLITTSAAGDSLALRMPAASMGLSLVRYRAASSSFSSSKAAAVTAGPVASAGCAADDRGGTGAGAVDVHQHLAAAAAGHGMSCSCGAGCGMGNCLGGGRAAAVHPAAAHLQQQHQQVARHAAAATAAAAGCDACSMSGLTAEDISDVGDGQHGCCVVEGDVRIVVMRGGVRLFYTWFNTAFLPASGCYTLSRAQLDKTSKALPHNLTLTVRYVDLQPHVSADDNVADNDGAETVFENEQDDQEAWRSGFVGLNGHTAGKVTKGTAQRGASAAAAAAAASQQHQEGGGFTASAPTALKLTSSKSSGTLCSAGSSSAVRQQQHQQQVCKSGSAPASPHGGGSSTSSRLPRTSSWRQQRPSIVSSSGASRLKECNDMAAPHFWDWDWGSLAAAAAADDAADAAAVRDDDAAAAAAAGADQTSAAGPTGGELQQQQQQRQAIVAFQQPKGQQGLQQSPFSDPTLQQQQCQAESLPQQQRHKRWQGMGQHGKQHKQPVSNTTANSNSTNSTVPALLMLSQSPAGIELPMFKRPAAAAAAAANSTMNALVDPATVMHSNPFDRCCDQASTDLNAQGMIHSTTQAAAAATVSSAQRQVSSNVWSSAARRNAVASSSSDSAASRNRRSFNNLWQLLQLQHHQQAQDNCKSSESQFDAKSSIHGSNGDAAAAAAADYSQNQQKAAAGEAAVAAAAADSPDDSWDGGDVYITDLLAADVLNPLLPAASPSAAVPGAVLGSCGDPLQGLLEALNWSTDSWRHQAGAGLHHAHSYHGSSRSSGSSKHYLQQQRRRHTFSGAATAAAKAPTGSTGSASNSRTGSPVQMNQDFMSKAPSAPATPQQHSSGRKVWGQDRQGPGFKPEPLSPAQSPTSLLDLEDDSLMLDSAGAGGGGGGVSAAAAATAASLALPPPALVPASSNGLFAGAAAAASPVGDPCCLDCVFGLHIGPCPAAAAAVATTAIKAGPPGIKQLVVSSVKPPAARTAATPAAAAAASKIRIPPPAAASGATTPSVPASKSPSRVHNSVPTINSPQQPAAQQAPGSAKPLLLKMVPTPPPLLPPPATRVIASSSSSSNSAGMQRSSSGPAGSTAGKGSSTDGGTGAASSAAARCSSSSSRDDEQLQGLLAAPAAAGDGFVAHSSSGGSCGSESVASMVQRWEQLEKAWQRSWWV